MGRVTSGWIHWFGSLRHLPWARGRFRRARIIRDSSARKNDEEREERSVHHRTKHQNGACRDRGHFFCSRLERFLVPLSLSLSLSRFRTIICTCVYDLPFLFFLFCLFLTSPCRSKYSRFDFTLHKHARRSTGASLFLLMFYRGNSVKWKRGKKRDRQRVYRKSDFNGVFLSDFPSLLSTEKTEKYLVFSTLRSRFLFFLTFLSLFLLSPLSLLI